MHTAAAIQTTTTIEHGKKFNPYRMFTGVLIPDPILINPDLTPSEKITYAVLCRYNGKNNRCFPALDTIAERVGVCRQQIIRIVADLENKKFIEVKRSPGRNNRYRFLWHNSFDNAAPLPAAETDKTTRNMDVTPARNMDVTPQREPEKENQTTTPPAVVVSLDPGELNEALSAVREAVPRTKGIRRTIREGIAEHGLDHVLRAIAYTNGRSKTHYGAYLHKAISAGWADGWTPTPTPPQRQNPAKIARQEALEAAAFAREQAELIEARAEASRKYRELPAEKKAEVRERFLAEVSAFDRRRCQRLSLDALGGSLPFIVWFSG